MNTNFFFLIILGVFYCSILVRANHYNSLITSNRKTHMTLLYIGGIFLGILVAFRPLNIPDALPYYERYNNAYWDNTIASILYSSSWFRGTSYSMSKPVNLLFYLSHSVFIPYRFFVVLIVIFELFIYIKYARKILKHFQIEYNEYFLFAMILLFYSFRYQFIAFAQGIPSCLSLMLLFFLIEKKYLKALFVMIMATSLHICALYYFVIAFIFVFIPVFKPKMYRFLWIFTGLFCFSGMAFKFGDTLLGSAKFILNIIVARNPIYDSYSGNDDDFSIGITNLLYYILSGFLIMVYNDNRSYWKLVNIIISSILVESVFGQFQVIHRFTDLAKLYMPVILVMYIYKSRPVYVLSKRKKKVIPIFSTFCFAFAHHISLMALLK